MQVKMECTALQHIFLKISKPISIDDASQQNILPSLKSEHFMSIQILITFDNLLRSLSLVNFIFLKT